MRKKPPKMNDDPIQIADHLIQQDGVDGALKTVSKEIAAIHVIGDNYRLSIWRETRQILRSKLAASGNREATTV